MKRVSATLCAAALTGILAPSAMAATLANDNAAAYSFFTPIVISPANGGSGFAPWAANVTNTGNSGQNGLFLATGNNANSQVNTTGNAWAIYANSGQTTNVIRAFNGALNVNQGVSFDIDNGLIDNTGVVGVSLQNFAGQNVWEYYFTGGQANYTVAAASVTGATPGFTNAGQHVDFVLNTPTTYQATIRRFSDNATFNVSGTLSSPSVGQGITQLRFFNFNGGSGGDHDTFFNNIAVTPEPASACVILLGAFATLSGRRRASRRA